MNEITIPIITLDGASGAGKGAIGLKLAQALGWHYLDSGVFYRLLALVASRQMVSLQDEIILASLAGSLDPQMHIHSSVTNHLELLIMWEEEDVTSQLRTEECGLKAAKVAIYPLVRKALVEAQRRFRQSPGLIADGRDMGVTIFPDACTKFFLTATSAARIARRQLQLKQQGNYASLSRIAKSIKQRDKSDQGRLAVTRQMMPDAYIIDTTHLSIDQVMMLIEQKLSEIGLHFR